MKHAPGILMAAAAVLATAAAFAPAASAAPAAPARPAAVMAGGEVAVPVHPVTYTTPVQSGAAQIPLVGAWKICLKSDDLECLTAEGDGPNMKIFQTGYSTFSEIQAGVSNGIIFVDQSGQCVHGTISSNVTVSSSCEDTNTASIWYLVGNYPNISLDNQAYGKDIATRGDTSGDYVYLFAPGTSGAWYATNDTT